MTQIAEIWDFYVFKKRYMAVNTMWLSKTWPEGVIKSQKFLG
jgi:hypothetical protein